MADFLHELTNKRDERIRIDAMINSQDTWANEEVMEPIPAWEVALMREVARQWTPPAGEEPF